MKSLCLPRGLGIAIVLAALFVVLSIDVQTLVAIGYGCVLAVAHVSRCRWQR